MPKKGMRTIFFTPSSPLRSTSPSPAATPPRTSLSYSLMEDRIDAADVLISKWNSDSDSPDVSVTSLFHNDRREAAIYLRAVRETHSAMRFFIKEDPNSHLLLRAQSLMQAAMNRLQKELYQILAANRDNLDPDSVSSRASTVSSLSDFEESDDEFQTTEDSITEVERGASHAMADLKAIADCMISSGYGKECVKIYTIIRKSIVDEGIYRLGVERSNQSKMNKTDWELIELKIKQWLTAATTAVKILFYGERLLCDHVFSSSESVRESCFTDISTDGALILLRFPELVANYRKTPEKIFRTLDLYSVMADLWPEIEFIFSFASTAELRNQAMNSMLKLSENVRMMMEELEGAVQKDTSRSPSPGGRIHPLTRYLMNYLSLLSDYDDVLDKLAGNWPLKTPSSLPESYFRSPASTISVRLAWLVLVLLCKIDGKAKLYNDVSVSYIFLANNLRYVVGKVRSSNLRHHLREDWVEEHEDKVKLYASSYERVAWSNVFASIPENHAGDSPEHTMRMFHHFGSVFEATCRKHAALSVPNRGLRDDIRDSLAKKLVPFYAERYEKSHRSFGEGNEKTIFSPDDLENYLSDLFNGIEASGSSPALLSDSDGSVS